MNLPREFTDRMQGLLAETDYTDFLRAMNEAAPVSIRLNRFKFNEPVNYEPVPWAENAYYLEKRPVFSSDPLWHAGAYYVQEASSMLLTSAFKEAVKQSSGSLKVLDLCAAPGGKSLLLASMLDKDDVLLSNEVIKSRVPVLAENIRKHGYSNVIITNSDSSDIARCGAAFDIAVIDAPCSGEGLFRRDPASIAEWSPENVKTCELRQQRIIDNAVNCIKTGGFLIYSTCTWNTGENEDQVRYICSKGFEEISFDVNGESCKSFRAYPHRFKGEGFFIALLRKTAESETVQSGKPSSDKLKRIKPDPEYSEMVLNGPYFRKFENKILAGTEALFTFFEESLSGLYCHSLGTEIGTLSDKRFIPSEYLPFSLLFNKKAFTEIETDQKQALQYLSKNSIPYGGRLKGYAFLTFRGIPIAMGKLAGNRINNLFPNEWRLRIQPQESIFFTI